MVDNQVVGHLWKIISDPSNPGRPAYGLVWGAPAAHLILANVLLGYAGKQTDAGKVQPSVLVNQIRAANNTENVQQALKLWGKNGNPEDIGIAESAARLIDLKSPTLALQMIERGPDTLPAQATQGPRPGWRRAQKRINSDSAAT